MQRTSLADFPMSAKAGGAAIGADFVDGGGTGFNVEGA
jgi:hypothetical protein